MRSAGASQVPVISGPADRIRAPLFGTASGNLSGKITLPVITADEDGTVQLLGGFSLGFGIGTELVPAQKSSGGAAVRLKVTAQTPGKSTAKTLAGDTSKFAPGILFVVDRWAPSGKGLLALWVPPADFTTEELKKTAEGVNKLRGVQGITVVDDPYETTPTPNHLLERHGVGAHRSKYAGNESSWPHAGSAGCGESASQWQDEDFRESSTAERIECWSSRAHRRPVSGARSHYHPRGQLSLGWSRNSEWNRVRLAAARRVERRPGCAREKARQRGIR